MLSKKSLPKITVHTVIKNEDRFIWYALKSVINFIDRIIIYDTGSTDNTIPIIHTIASAKIILESHSVSTRQELTALRQQQLDRTTTPWFMLLDGDEIWPEKNLHTLLHAATTADNTTIAFINKTRNCIGDIFHYLPASTGHYHIKGLTGHLNIRLIKNIPGLKVMGDYPLEAYTLNGQPIQQLKDRIEFVDTWYLHTTHLPRSTHKSTTSTVIDRLSKRKFWRPSLKLTKSELPSVFWQPHPALVPAPPLNRCLNWLL